VIRFAAPTVSELLFQLQSASEDSSFFTAQQQPPAANRSELFCLNIIAHSADEFAQKCQLATHALEQSQFSASMLAQGILFRKPLSGPALVACLFSGQGSSYPGMLLPWIEETQAIASAKNQWNEWLLSNGHPSLKELYADTDRQLGVDLLRTQLALLSSEALLFSALQQLNVRPDRVAGHSFGEYGALWAARCWDGPTAIAAATARAYSVTSSLSEPSSLLCAFCDSSTANTVCSDCDGHVYVANTNGRQQVVLGGKRDALKRAAQLLARLNVRVLELSVPFAFHTPELAPASPVLARHLDQLTLSPPHVPLLSSVTNLYEAEPSRLRDNLARQLTTPVHWTTLVERLVSEGVKLFIEVGPGRVLSSLGQRDFQQAEDLLFVPCDDAKKGPQNQLAIVEAAYDLFHCPAPTLPQTPIVVSTPQTQEKFEDQRVPLLELSGSPFEMGYTCGVALRDAMRPLLERMISIPRDTYGFPGKLSKVRLHSEQWFDDDARAEIAGLAAGCGVNVESVLALNLVLYPDIDAGCCHFVSQPEKSSLGQWLHGGNEDLPIGLLLGSALQRVVQLRRPAQGLRHVLFSAVGQVGALTGMNAAGLSVTSAMLLDRPLSPQNQAGFVHGVLVGKILAQADSLAKAEQICRETPHRGAWGLMVASAAEQRAIYLEFDGQQWASEPVAASRTAANHSELLGSLTDVPEHSVARGNRLRHLLASGSPSSDRFASACTALLDRFDATRGRSVRHKTMNTVCRVDHQASILMAPQVGKAWLAPGDAEELDDAIDSVPTNFIELDFQSFLAAEKVPSETKPSNAVKTLVTSEKPITTNTTANPTATVSQPHFDSHCDADNFVAQHASWDAAPPDEVCADVCARLSVRMVPSVLQSVPSVAEVVAGKRALILGDSPVAQTLNHKLRQLHCDTLVMSNSTDAEALCEQVSSAAQSAPFDHLFVLTAWDDQNSVANSIDAAFAETTWARERQLHVMTPYRVAQAWYGQLAPQRHDGMYWFITATRMGGDCGLSGDTPQHHGGAQTGLAKAIFLERRVNVGPDLQAAAIDFANSSPLDASAVDQICEQMLQELTRSAVDLEVAYNGEQRRVLRMLNAPLTTSPSSADRNPSAGDLSALPLSAATGCWLITGGARGVTAEIAKGLGNAMRQALQRAGKSQQPGMLHLIGSSPQPDVPAAWLDYDDSQKLELRNTIVREALANKQEKPADAWSRVEKAIEVARSLREMERQGLRVQYHSCDIANRNKLAGLLDSIRAAGEPIVGVVHGAGFEKACRFVAKQIPLVEKTVAAKVDGAALLMQLTAQDPLHSFIAFGSISGRFGAVGQTDYAMANEWLVKLVARYRVLRPEVHAVSLDWHSWADVGMAARPETKHAKLLAKLRFMPTDEGVRHFLQEVSQQSAEREVVITDWRYYKLRFPSHGVIPPVTPTPVSRVDEQHDAQPSSASSPSSLLTQADQKLCKRYVLRLQPIAAPQTNRSWLGPALIVGDNPTARSLQTLLQQQGVSVTLFAPRKASANGDITTSLAQLQQLLAERWYPHLFLVTANDVDACLLPGWKPYQERRTWGVQFPYQAIRAWMQASHTHRARQGGSLVASLNLHGDFGFHARPAAPESGALTGVLKSLRLEANRHDWSDLVVKAVDSAPDTTALSIARQLVAEALSHEDLVEVAYASEQRFSPAIQEAPLPSRQGTPSWITPGGNWLAIGGARGITGATALRLAQRLGVTMHLLGRQPLQPLPEAWLRLDASGRDQLKKQIAADAIAAGETPSSRWKQIAQQLEMQDNLRRFQTLGLRATYHAIDTADPLAWEQLLQSLRAQYGPIHGVIQGAGARNSGVIEKKSDVALQQMLAAKQDITQLLFELLRPDPLECFIGFGSVTGRLGGNGGTDYALGADMICKQIGWLRADRPNVHAVSFHWHGWGEVGMMVDPAGFGARSVSNVSLMSPDEGADHILAELNAGTPESEVLITDDSYLSVVRENGVKLLELPSNNTNTYPLPLDPSVIQAEIGSLAVQITLDPQSHSFLSQHLFRGRPLLPMVAMVEGVLQAASCSGLLKADQTYELADFQIERGLKFLQSDPITVRVLFNPTNTGYHVRLVRDFFDTKGRLLEKDQPIASCDFFPGSSAVAQHTSVLAVQPLPIDAQNWFPVEYPEHQISIYHGAPFRWLSHCRTVANHASSNARKHGANDTTLQGRLTPPQAHNDWHRTPQTPWISPLGAIDGTLFACGIAKWLEDSASVAIPSGFSRLVGSPSCPTDEELFTAVKLIDEQQLAGNGQLQAQFDAITYTKDGTVRFAIHGYTAAVLKSS
jgi:malonyl CoA-acyl carrier protein transacylase/NAD(P)-dependent dehydrogenase (short-subunit alcohol dehydrogenase family)